MIAIWPLVFYKGYVIKSVLIVVLTTIVFAKLKDKFKAMCLFVALVVCLYPVIGHYWQVRDFLYKHRNFYGIHKVFEEDSVRFLMHGQIIHGSQYLSKHLQHQPLMYYEEDTPIGEILTTDKFAFKNISIIGLGGGNLLAYMKEDQTVDYLELDEDVNTIANEYFTYIRNSSSKLKVIIGDARITIKERPEKYYDLIIVDAFSGDAIPTHLLTIEALEEYRKHLKEEGVLLFHISNRYLRLGPVLAAAANQLEAKLAFKLELVSFAGLFLRSPWVAISWNDTTYKKLTHDLKWKQMDVKDRLVIKPWTDDHTNVLAAVKFERIFKSLVDFEKVGN